MLERGVGSAPESNTDQDVRWSGGERTRTADFYVANVALCQLSYTPGGTTRLSGVLRRPMPLAREMAAHATTAAGSLAARPGTTAAGVVAHLSQTGSPVGDAKYRAGPRPGMLR